MFRHLLAKRGLSLERLHVLLELEEAGSLAKAARGDDVRQSQYSKQLRLLSEYFGTTLTERQGRELHLTEAGRRLASLARGSFSGLDDFQRDCNRQPLAVTLGAGDSLLQWILLPRLGSIQKRLRNTHITLKNLRTPQVADGLENLKLEFDMLREDAVPSRHQKERLVRMGYSLFVPRSLVPGKQSGYRHMLESVPMIRHNPSGDLARRVRAMADQEGLKPNYCATCESFPQACRAVLSGSYAALLPTIARTSDLRTGDFLEVEWPALKAEARWIALAYNPKMLALRPGLERVLRALKEELKSR